MCSYTTWAILIGTGTQDTFKAEARRWPACLQPRAACPPDGRLGWRSKGHCSQHPIYCQIDKCISLVRLCLPLTRLMLQKQPLSLTHLIYVIILPWLRAKTSSAASQQGWSLIYLPLCLQAKGLLLQPLEIPRLAAPRDLLFSADLLQGLQSRQYFQFQIQTEGNTVGNTLVSRPNIYWHFLTLWRAAGRDQER